ncbi:DUF4399 domain-containing protein [Methylobacterium longum]|uniref:DUF4399 domain-containing protein n=1 Tax=Methylobacterium longum TaxID=767694 RepID=A0ABT8AYQ5_9HYPH|nr:DUF4399 domain-containing protein [Methylobacterium longum]MDN3574586.1 DUF4399 domain-containing protein [Methylobacterium longum]
MGVTQAGSGAKNVGHHHLLIDAKDAIGPGSPSQRTRPTFISAAVKPRHASTCPTVPTRCN